MKSEIENSRGIVLKDNTDEKASLLTKVNFYLIIKRFFDIICSLIGIILLVPVILFVKLISIAYGDFHSIFYSHTRIGKDGKEFKLYKFRSMVPNADEVLKEMLKDPKLKKEWDENQKFSNDKRITTIGKFLRKTSLDEMPQFINIFIGNMSMIGPRPLVKGELDNHNGNHDIYEKVKPGITGWWACNGRSNLSYEERLNLEYYYVENMSFILDLKCIFKTIKVVFFKTGAK